MKMSLKLFLILIVFALTEKTCSSANGFSKQEVDLPKPHIAIIGATGVGKSSLANVLIGESPLCSDCTFPICNEGASCTKETTFAVKPWLGYGEMFTVVDTPGFGDTDQDDSVLIDEMMSVLKDTVKTANALLLVVKGTETRLDASLQQMLREMKALFGEDLWMHVVIGVSFWPFSESDIQDRNKTCTFAPEYCHDEKWFQSMMTDQLEAKFHIGQNLPFAFIDSWAKHPANIGDQLQQDAFARETDILWNFAQTSEEFVFKSIQDVLDENNDLKIEVAYLKGVIETNITEIIKDLTDLRIAQGYTSDIVTDHGVQLSEQMTAIVQNRDSIQVNIEEINIVKGRVGSTEENINNNVAAIQALSSNLQGLSERHDNDVVNIRNEVTNSVTFIQDVSSRLQILNDRFENSLLRFHVESAQFYGDWGFNSFINYETKLVDTHNAVDMGEGAFVAPFPGVYGFLFYGSFRTQLRSTYFFAYRNDEPITLFEEYSSGGERIRKSGTIYFALELQQNDRVRIYSGDTEMYMGYHSAKFSGFLLHQN